MSDFNMFNGNSNISSINSRVEENNDIDQYINELHRLLQSAKEERKKSDSNLVSLQHRINLLQREERTVI